jgi:hypothetical protein
MACRHPNFTASVNVNRLEDCGRFTAEVTISCQECGVPMKFLGLGLGLDLNGAAVSPDGTEARLAIAPQGEVVPPISGVEGFTIRKKT